MKIVLKVCPRIGSRELNALFAEVWPDHRAVNAGALLKRALVHVAAYEGKRLVGFAKVVSDGGVHGFLLDPTVVRDKQRRGLGTRLVKACVREARQRGVAWLHVDFEPRLAGFYRRCGFRRSLAGVRRLG